MAKIIIYVDGRQELVDEEQVKIYDPFPDNNKKEGEKKDDFKT